MCKKKKKNYKNINFQEYPSQTLSEVPLKYLDIYSEQHFSYYNQNQQKHKRNLETVCGKQRQCLT